MKALLLSLLLAATPTVTAQEAFQWPFPAETAIVMEAPDYAWGIRPVAREIDEELDGLRIYRRRGLQCEDYPDRVCLTVTVETLDESVGGWAWKHGDMSAEIHLNALYSTASREWRKGAACHELLHTLGFNHHTEGGCVGDVVVNTTSPSDVEWDVLRQHYDQEGA